VPEGGQVYVYSWDDGDIPLKARTYAADRVTVIEDDITVSTSTDSPTLSPVKPSKQDVDMAQIITWKAISEIGSTVKRINTFGHQKQTLIDLPQELHIRALDF